MVSQRIPSSMRSSLPRKEKVIPNEQLGVAALPTISETMEGILDWLKSERLHKYWPVFSRMNYPTLVGLTEDNLDYTLNCIGSEPITNGARGRILRCTERLRERSGQLNSIDDSTALEEIAEVFKIIATTPLSTTENEPNGICLIRLFRQKFNQAVGFHGPLLVSVPKLKKALQSYSQRREVPQADRDYVERIMKNLVLAAGISPWRSSPSPSPPSSLASASPPTSRQLSNHQALGASALRPRYVDPVSARAPIIRPSFSNTTSWPSERGLSNTPPGFHLPIAQSSPLLERTGFNILITPKIHKPRVDQPRTTSIPSTSGNRYTSGILKTSGNSSATGSSSATENSSGTGNSSTTGNSRATGSSSATGNSRATGSSSTSGPSSPFGIFSNSGDFRTSSTFSSSGTSAVFGTSDLSSPALSITSGIQNISIGRHLPYFCFLPAESANQDHRTPPTRPFKPPPQVFNAEIWPDSKVENAFRGLEIDEDASIRTAIGAAVDVYLDLNTIWGGTRNQVMLDLNDSSPLEPLRPNGNRKFCYWQF